MYILPYNTLSPDTNPDITSPFWEPSEPAVHHKTKAVIRKNRANRVIARDIMAILFTPYPFLTQDTTFCVLFPSVLRWFRPKP